MRSFGVHLNALRAFEAAARLSSFSRAADELNITHSTVSHHICGLEKNLGVKLFERRNRKVVLTSAGDVLFPALKKSFDAMGLALEATKSYSTRHPIKISMTPSFANMWLLPRLREFQDANPEIEIQISTSLDISNFAREGFDIGIRAGLGNWPNVNADFLMPIHMSPLCSPSLLKGKSKLKQPKDLLKHKLLHADVNPETGIESEWSEWFTEVKHSDVNCSAGLSFRDPGLALKAAVNGLGIAMGYLELASEDIRTGRLIRPFEAATKHPWSYYLVKPETAAPHPQILKFCEWLHASCNQ